jgi:hypothetical protein
VADDSTVLSRLGQPEELVGDGRVRACAFEILIVDDLHDREVHARVPVVRDLAPLEWAVGLDHEPVTVDLDRLEELS